MSKLEDRVRRIALDALQKAKEYEGFDLVPEQVAAFRADPVWSLFGMDNENFLKLRYIGNYYTAIFRKMGDMYEGFVRTIVAKSLGLKEADMPLHFELVIEGEAQARTLDAQIDLTRLRKRDAERVREVVKEMDPAYKGNTLGFEVRCCYQIGDSKRIQADENAAGYLKKGGYLPVLMIFCTTSLKSPVRRLRQSWVVSEGKQSYDLLQRLTGFDLYGCLGRLKPELTATMQYVVKLFQLPTL